MTVLMSMAGGTILLSCCSSEQSDRQWHWGLSIMFQEAPQAVAERLASNCHSIQAICIGELKAWSGSLDCSKRGKPVMLFLCAPPRDDMTHVYRVYVMRVLLVPPEEDGTRCAAMPFAGEPSAEHI
eukprot:scaffold144112_cov63-Attheya_sp.AAC.1